MTYHCVDVDRPEIFATGPDAPRELLAQVWYPSKAGPSSVRARYMPEADAVLAAFARLHHKPAFLFNQLRYVTTNAIPSAPVADDEPSYPVLLFFEGSSGYWQMNTFQVEELVSHGYVVVAIDQSWISRGGFRSRRRWGSQCQMDPQTSTPRCSSKYVGLDPRPSWLLRL